MHVYLSYPTNHGRCLVFSFKIICAAMHLLQPTNTIIITYKNDLTNSWLKMQNETGHVSHLISDSGSGC